nr:hypothetical protein [uncultured Sphingosinicella sp.]
MQKVSFKQLRVGALFKFGFISNVAIWSVISSIFGIAAMLGFNTVRLKGAPVYGVPGLLLSLLFGVICVTLGTLLFVGGAKIASMFSERLSSITIDASPEDDR